MAGTSIGMGTCTLVGLRVSVPPTYIPGYEKNGQTISPCLKVRGFVNRKNGRSDIYDLRLWGKLADIGARSLSVGKEFHAEVRPESYQGRVWKDKGNELVLNTDGTAVTVLKTAFVVKDIVFGAESEKHITDEIAAGKRPANYKDGGQGSAAWSETLKKRAACTTTRIETYKGKQVEMFGHAIVQRAGATAAPAPAANLQNQVANAADDPALNAAFGNAQAMHNAGTGNGPF
jgi:hypothetical protein